MQDFMDKNHPNRFNCSMLCDFKTLFYPQHSRKTHFYQHDIFTDPLDFEHVIGYPFDIGYKYDIYVNFYLTANWQFCFVPDTK